MLIAGIDKKGVIIMNIVDYTRINRNFKRKILKEYG